MLLIGVAMNIDKEIDLRDGERHACLYPKAKPQKSSRGEALGFIR
jgi:hypothetical protein